MKFFSEFKEFAMRGNVVDMAVGVVIGGAFGKIVTSLVSDIFMPLISLAVGGVDFTNWFVQLGGRDVKVYDTLAQAQEAGVAVLSFGNFLQVVFDFIIVALCIFLFIKAINALKKKKEEEPAPAPAPSKEEVLLTEIRDLLKNK
ncbi:MAG: large conductance mechanosensitive channel protein MscL [Paludibacteraceae bacterium]|nr:large conductance mechanosensitive channel protein MscL [Paludibacteraceae bacterium]MBO7635625.1 large conductance mechanosensitive channel protein MscL [Paludibacteraceae bacterium]MBR5973030.1 large conductance mechanosensitive channel protein MscL [Paludibacteraceae bacterium]